MAAGLCPRLRAFVASSLPLLAARSGALPLPLRRPGPAMSLAARARRGLGSSTAAAPLAEDFATG
jgi:peptide deformylase